MMRRDATNQGGAVEFNMPATLSLSEEGLRMPREESIARCEDSLPEAEYPAPEAEITPPGSASMNAAAADAGDESSTRNKLHKRLKQLIGYTTAAAVVAVTFLGPFRWIWGIQQEEKEPTLRQFLAQNDDWYSAEYDMYLHFADGYGWTHLSDGTFQRVIWTIDNEGSDEEQLKLEFITSYFHDGTTLVNADFTTEPELTRDDESISLTTKVDVGTVKHTSTSFTPVDSIPFDGSVVERFGTMGGQQILESIGAFVPTDPTAAEAPNRYSLIVFKGGYVDLTFGPDNNYVVRADYTSPMSASIWTEPASYQLSDGSSAKDVKLFGFTVFRESGVYFYMQKFINGADGMLDELVAASLPDITPEPEPEPEPPAARTPIRTVLAEHPSWYSAEYDVYLHFNEGVGWVYDHGNFHRLLWTIEEEGTDEERLWVETGYMYYGGELGKRIIVERTLYVDVFEPGDGTFSLAGNLGVENADDAEVTFMPVDAIPVDSSVVDGFGAMSGQEALESIASFIPTEIRPQTGIFTWTGLSLSAGKIMLMMNNGDSLTIDTIFDRHLVPHFDTGHFEYSTADGTYMMSGTFSGSAQFREDGVYLSFSALGGGDTIFVSGDLPEPVTPAPVTPGEAADDAFPALGNLWPDTPVEPWGSLGEYYVIFDNQSYLVAGDAYGDDWTTRYPGASYDPTTNTLTLTNVTTDFLEVNWMGNGFTINLVGDNHIGGLMIWGFYSGGSVTFTGTGTLTINEGLANDYGILMRAEESQTCIMVDSGVTLDVYGSEAAILVYETTMDKGIYYLKPLTMTGGERAVLAKAEDADLYIYSVVDENGNPSKHVRFGR